jgi:hypothetical protein
MSHQRSPSETAITPRQGGETLGEEAVSPEGQIQYNSHLYAWQSMVFM